jgi:hypothetical protein
MPAGVSIGAVVVRRTGDRTTKKGVVMMMPYGSYQLWQVERTKTDAERRQADAELGMMAAELSRFFREITGPVRGLRRRRLPPAPLPSAQSGAVQTNIACLPSGN